MHPLYYKLVKVDALFAPRYSLKAFSDIRPCRAVERFEVSMSLLWTLPVKKGERLKMFILMIKPRGDL